MAGRERSSVEVASSGSREGMRAVVSSGICFLEVSCILLCVLPLFSFFTLHCIVHLVRYGGMDVS